MVEGQSLPRDVETVRNSLGRPRPTDDPFFEEAHAALDRLVARAEQAERELFDARQAVLTEGVTRNVAERRITELEAALRGLVNQVNDVQRTLVIRESQTYRDALTALSTEGEPDD